MFVRAGQGKILRLLEKSLFDHVADFFT